MNTSTLATIAHNMRQDGSVNVDEERALVLGLPPLEDGVGQEYQRTPVGGGAPPQQPAMPANGSMNGKQMELPLAGGEG